MSEYSYITSDVMCVIIEILTLDCDMMSRWNINSKFSSTNESH